ncbi:MAG: class I SAM-dependent methyltransferase, partial [Actinobacteria bacterium]|nr:class I SAM-dependent methyltransferase [Actinomycetota bacterium]
SCGACNNMYETYDGVPVFTEKHKIIQIDIQQNSIARKIYNTIPEATTWIDNTAFDFINKLPDSHVILNLGSGQGIFDRKITKKMINLDIVVNERTEVVADAHYLPFKNNSIDCIFSNAVLEHVKKPWIVASEIERVLKVGGYVVINLPFLNIIHDDEDYFRFTLKGIRELFPNCKQIYGGVSSGCASFLPICALEYFKLFIPTDILKKAFSFVWGHLFYRLKSVDRMVSHKEKYCYTANSFYFIGTRLNG